MIFYHMAVIPLSFPRESLLKKSNISMISKEEKLTIYKY
jgi:hypothetical protein